MSKQKKQLDTDKLIKVCNYYKRKYYSLLKKTKLKIKGTYNEAIQGLGRCPNCNRLMSYDESQTDYNYCPTCGQALDWSGLDDIIYKR